MSAVAFAGSALSARLLGPDGKGELAVATVAGTLGVVFLSLGVPYGLARAYLMGHAGQILGTAVAHAIALLPLSLLAWLVLPSLTEVAPLPLAIVVFGLIPAAVFSSDVAGALLAAKAVGTWQMARLVDVSVFTVGVGVLLAVDVRSGTFALALFAAGTAVAAVLQLLLLVRKWGFRGRLTVRQASALSSATYVGSVVDRFLLRADQFVVAAVSGAAGVGIYGVAVNISEVGQYLGNAFGMSVMEDRTSLPDRDLVRIALLAAGAVGALMVPVCLAGWFLVAPVFGDGFRDARLAAVLLAPGVAARAAAVVVIQPLMARGQGRTCSVISGAVLILGVAAWYAGAELGGINGAALANSCVYLVQAALFLAVPFLAVRREWSQSV